MLSSYSPYELPSLVVASVASILAWLAWRRRPTAGASAFALMMLAVVEWSLASSLAPVNGDISSLLFWDRAEYLGSLTIPFAWLVFVIEYCGWGKWLTWRREAALAVIPLATFLLVCTNGQHGLIYSHGYVKMQYGYAALAVTYGPWFWVHVTYSYALMLAGALLLFHALLRSPLLYRRQVGILLLGGVIPWAANIIDFFGVSPIPYIDLTHIAMMIMGFAGAWSLYKYRLFDVMPIARDAVIEGMMDAFLVLDSRQRIVDINPAASLLIGKSPREVVGLPVDDAFLGWSARDSSPGGKLAEQNVIAVGEGATERFFELHRSTLEGLRRDAEATLLIMRDITDKQRISEELEQSQRRYRLLFNSGRDMIFVNQCTEDGEAALFLEANDFACERLGYERDDLLARSMADLLQYSSKGDAENPPASASEGVTETVLRTRAGMQIPVEISRHFFVLDGRPAVLSVARDLTERIQAENQLQNLVSQLTRSNNDLEQFAYVASHDLQEPLRVVANYVELLGERYDGQLDERADSYIRFAVNGVSRMQQLIGDLLEYSRISSSRREMKPVSLRHILDIALHNLQAKIIESGAMIKTDPLPDARMDEVQGVQLLQNLLGNALKFNGENPPRIYIGAQAAGDDWVISVRDEGIGIDPKYAEKIFAIFQRLHTRNEYPGTGIGLAICKKIVEQHQGRIWVESKPAHGSTFYFTLPARAGAKTEMTGSQI